MVPRGVTWHQYRVWVSSAGMAAVTAHLTGTHGRTRDTTILGRAAAATRVAAPSVGRWLAGVGRRARTTALTVGGLGSLTWAAWDVARPLGLAVAGVSALALEYLTTPSQR